MQKILKQLVSEKIIDYDRLVLRYYHKLKLTEIEAIALIKLHDLLQDKQEIIDPKKFSKWLSISPSETAEILESLMSKGYLKIKLITTPAGKEKETFNIDFFLSKDVDLIEKKHDNYKETQTHKWVEYLEDSLQKPLTHLDVEMITHWIEEDQYTFEMVKEATLDALKRKHPSVRLIDQYLLKQLDKVKTSPKKKDVLKEFHALWDE